MDIYKLIFGMMFATMLPRIIPFYTFDPEKVPNILRVLLANIPYCVLGALILPGGLNGIEGKPIVSLACLLAAAAISSGKPNLSKRVPPRFFHPSGVVKRATPSVYIAPGKTAFVRILYWAKYTDRVWVRLITPALEAP